MINLFDSQYLLTKIILMSTRLQKLQKIKPSSKIEPTLIPPVTQTIIINNPNININYMNETSRQQGPLSSRGLDSWNLNNNLKQFSQTRQLGFFKKKQRNKSNSPYIIHKVRTQDFRSINKIYAPGHNNHSNNPMKETLGSFRNNQTLTHIQPHTIEIQKETERQRGNQRTTLERVIHKRDKTITEKFYQGQVRKNPRIELLKNFDTLPTSHLINSTNPELHNADTSRTKHFRKGRFEVATQRLTSHSNIDRQIQEDNESTDSPTKKVRMDDREDREIDSADSDIKVPTKMAPRLNMELRRRAYNKTISNIDKLFLSNCDDYFDQLKPQKVPQAQIQLCVNSLSHPERVGLSKDKSTKRQGNQCGQYDFTFEEERKRRPRTPRRKKYQIL